ncbi:MAG: hypothetical protein COA69_01615 [Robiginitomaculum sp.]|nr:MAG: hypothetical protein COA69_01615 [Robiginitomaculum sp.]
MIGKLRTRIGLYVPQTTPDAFGGVQTSWVSYGQAWAHISPLTARETDRNGRPSTLKNYRIIIRWQRDFPERIRVMWGERILRMVTSSDPDTRRERLHLMCEEEQQ